MLCRLVGYPGIATRHSSVLNKLLFLGKTGHTRSSENCDVNYLIASYLIAMSLNCGKNWLHRGFAFALNKKRELFETLLTTVYIIAHLFIQVHVDLDTSTFLDMCLIQT